MNELFVLENGNFGTYLGAACVNAACNATTLLIKRHCKSVTGNATIEPLHSKGKITFKDNLKIRGAPEASCGTEF